MLLYSYRIGGVDYESSQDITDMREVWMRRRCAPVFPARRATSPATPRTAS